MLNEITKEMVSGMQGVDPYDTLEKIESNLRICEHNNKGFYVEVNVDGEYFPVGYQESGRPYVYCSEEAAARDIKRMGETWIRRYHERYLFLSKDKVVRCYTFFNDTRCY